MSQTTHTATPIQHDPHSAHGTETHAIHLPAPTPWPFLMALGVCLLVGSLVLSFGVGVLGGLLTLGGAIGWFFDMFPHEKHEDIAVTSEVVTIEPSRAGVARIEVGETHRAQLPLQTFPITSGIKGGI